MTDLRYPIGPFERPADRSPAQRAVWLDQLAELPAHVRAAVAGLPEGGLDRPYRDGGWTARQVVHHLADSHMNSYVRFRLALTEETPSIKAYDEAAWAELADARTAPVDLSLSLLGSLHARWVALLRSVDEPAWNRRLIHPESGELDLYTMLGLYAWHGRHHLGHIRSIRA
ncbi:MAG: bacillithiol transferase BstA [Bryobacteraceae bacterium]